MTKEWSVILTLVKGVSSFPNTERIITEQFNEPEQSYLLDSYRNSFRHVGGNRNSTGTKTNYMFTNYLKIAWRNLLTYRQFTILNVIGLSTGLAGALLIWLWVQDELNVDHFNAKDSQLYQVIKTSPNADGTVDTHETTPGLLALSMAAEIP